MPVTKQHPPPAQPWIRETAPAAPFLTSDNRCSACNIRPMPSPAGKVCPNCYALLYHEDWGAAERKRKEELNAQARAVEQERRDIKRKMQAEAAEARKQFRIRLAEEALQRVNAASESEQS